MMTEWWTYRLSDFLMFSPRTYQRLFELYNSDVWPAQWLALAAGALTGVALALGLHQASRLAWSVLAVAWAWVGWAFHWQRFEPINWAAAGFALAFGLQALLFAAMAFVTSNTRRRAGPARAIGLALLLVALVMPALMAALGRPWAQSQVFGFAPDPTVLATLGVLLLAGPKPDDGAGRALSVVLWIVPLLWCGVGGAMMWTLGEVDAFVLPVAAAVALWARPHSLGTKIHSSR